MRYMKAMMLLVGFLVGCAFGRDSRAELPSCQMYA